MYSSIDFINIFVRSLQRITWDKQLEKMKLTIIVEPLITIHLVINQGKFQVTDHNQPPCVVVKGRAARWLAVALNPSDMVGLNIEGDLQLAILFKQDLEKVLQSSKEDLQDQLPPFARSIFYHLINTIKSIPMPSPFLTKEDFEQTEKRLVLLTVQLDRCQKLLAIKNY